MENRKLLVELQGYEIRTGKFPVLGDRWVRFKGMEFCTSSWRGHFSQLGNKVLEEVIEKIRSYEGITRKNEISFVVDQLREVSDFGETVIDFGDDAAVLKDGDGYLLLSADEAWSKLNTTEPYAAGKAPVMVSVNDIYAKGDQPFAMVKV